MKEIPVKVIKVKDVEKLMHIQNGIEHAKSTHGNNEVLKDMDWMARKLHEYQLLIEKMSNDTSGN